jgi:hypothetical protein
MSLTGLTYLCSWSPRQRAPACRWWRTATPRAAPATPARVVPQVPDLKIRQPRPFPHPLPQFLDPPVPSAGEGVGYGLFKSRLDRLDSASSYSWLLLLMEAWSFLAASLRS